MSEFELSAKLRDKLTGYQGSATARLETLDGTIQFCLVKEMGDDGKYPEGTYIDFERLEQISDPLIDVSERHAPFNLGDRLKDKISGLEGIATAKVDYMNGCLHYAITPKKLKKEIKPPKTEYVPVEFLELVKAKVVKIQGTETGCDMTPPSRGLSTI